MSLWGRLRRMGNMALAMVGRRAMITCEEALAAMHELLDGELSPDDQDRVQAHLEVCARCYPTLRAEESFRSALRLATEGQVAPEELTVRVRALLHEAAGG